MPATSLICYERRMQLAASVRAATSRLPAQVHRTRTAADFQSEVPRTPFPVALFEAEADPDLLPELVFQAKRHNAVIVIIGDVGGWNRQMHLRESGALCLLAEIPALSRWQVLLARLVEHSQQRMAACGGQ